MEDQTTKALIDSIIHDLQLIEVKPITKPSIDELIGFFSNVIDHLGVIYSYVDEMVELKQKMEAKIDKLKSDGWAKDESDALLFGTDSSNESSDD